MGPVLPSPSWKKAHPPKKFVIEEATVPPLSPQLLPPPPALEPPPPGDPDTLAILREKNHALLGRPPESAPAPPQPTVVRAILGFVALLVLAYLAGQSQVQDLERRLNIAHMITAGLPFLFLGLLASQPAVGILTPSMLREVAPLLPLGLGWIGFVVGSRLDGRTLNSLPNGTGAAVVATTAIPIGLILAACGLLLFLGTRTGVLDFGPRDALRDALLLATAGAMSARSAPYFLQAFAPRDVVPARLTRIIELEQLAGVFGLMMVSAYFRPQGVVVAWQLPGTAWLFITLGIGTTMGIVIFAILAKVSSGPQFTAALLGAVAFTAGMASFLRLSSVSVCFIAGAIVVNLGDRWRAQLREVLERLERPVYFLFLVIAGALWRPGEWQGWLLMVVFVISRFAAKWLGALALRKHWMRDMARLERIALTGAPMGALSVAIVVSAQDLYSGITVGWIVTAVIGGAVVMEFVLQVAARRADRRPDPGRDAPVPAPCEAGGSLGPG